MRRAVALPVAVLLPVLLAGCREAARELANGPGGAPSLAVLVESLATRFGPIEREPAFDAVRPQLARAAMVPSRVVDAPGMWTSSGDDWRAMEFLGHASERVYRLGVRGSAPEPRDPGDYRGRLCLQRTGAGRFVWTLEEELAVGPVRPEDLSAALTALLRSAEATSAAEARVRIHEALPRSTSAVSRLLRLESLEIARDATGAAALTLAVRIVPDGIRPFAPRYAAFLDKHATPTELRAVVADLSGAAWWTLDAAENLWTLRLRVRDGSLVPLAGPADRRLPGNVRATIEYSTKVGLFRIGVGRLVADVALARGTLEKGFVAHFLEEPDWRLPFLVEPLMRASLRQPFEGEGSHLGWSAREQAGGATVLSSQFRLQIKESWIVRWLGGASSSILSDFRMGAEAESDRFIRECLLALRDDLVALASAPC
jgi:hypothetical protein